MNFVRNEIMYVLFIIVFSLLVYYSLYIVYGIVFCI